jgi:predicted dehydrogenase
MAPLKVGIVGAARVAVYAMIAAARDVPRVKVAAVAARDPARAKAFAAEHGIVTVHQTYDALIGDPAIDLVYVATPPSLHAEIAIKALEAGKNVLVEKPFSMNADEARRVLDVARAQKRRVIEAFHYRHHALWHRIVEVVRGGAIGRLTSLSAAFHAPIEKSGGEFRWNTALGGGALMDLGCYPLQWVRVMAGEEPVVERATMRVVDGVDAETTAALRFPGGALAHVACSMDGTAFAASLTVAGEHGTMTVINPLAPQFGHQLTTEIGGMSRSETVEGPSTFVAQLEAVAATLLDGAPFPLAADDPVKSMAAIDAVRAASLG